MGTYSEPVSKLQKIGALEFNSRPQNTDYITDFGLSAGDIPELIRLATDEEFIKNEDEDSEEADLNFAATIYAIYALRQLHAVEASEPLLAIFKIDEDNEWGEESLTKFYATIGPKALPVLRNLLLDTTQNAFTRGYSTEYIQAIGENHPEVLAECIEILTSVLTTEQDPDVNASIIAKLINLQAVKALPIIEQAFQENRVDLSFVGDWEDVQVSMGVKERPINENLFAPLPSPNRGLLPGFRPALNAERYFAQNSPKQPPSKKRKDKLSKASRKQNRRKK